MHEQYASENVFLAAVNQQNVLVKFFTRMVNKHEHRHASVEKEAAAIVK